MTPEQLKVALKQQTTYVAVGALAWADGQYRFEQKPIEAISAVPDMRMSPVALVMEAARKHSDFGSARGWLEQHAQERLNRSPELEREMFALKTFWPGESVSPTATVGKTVGEVMARIKEPEYPLLRYLCQSGLLMMSGGPKAAPKPHPGAPASAGDEDKGKVFTPAEVTARKMLFGERDHLKEASHYEVLGIPGTAEL